MYKLQVALDGVHFLEDPFVTLKVNNEDIQDETDFTQCNKEDLIDLTEKFVDAETGEEIAPAEVNKAYIISMYNQFDIGPKAIEGYEYVSGPDMKGYKDLFVIDTDSDKTLGLDGKPGRDDEFVFKYRKITNKPNQPNRPDTNPNKPNDQNKPNGNVTGNQGTGSVNGQLGKPSGSKQPIKTGDTTPILPITAAAVVSLAGIVFVLSKKRR